MTDCGSTSPESTRHRGDTLEGFARRLAELIEAEAGSGFGGSILDRTRFSELALRLHSLQARTNPRYRRFAADHEPDRWADIPGVPTEAFGEFVLSSLPEGERTRVFRSSGTTGGERSRHFHSEASLALYRRSLLGWFLHHFPDHGRQSLLVLTPSEAEVPDSSLVHMFARVGGSFVRCEFLGRLSPRGTWELDGERLSAVWRDAVDEERAVVLAGTAFNFVQVAEDLPRMEPLPPGSALLETGGYKGRTRRMSRSGLHALLERITGIAPHRMVSEYGMCELSSQAYDLGRQDRIRGFRFPPWVRWTVVDPETGAELPEGECGLIRIFDLANVWSVMAIQTGDLGCRIDDGFELRGRVADAPARGCSLLPGV